MIAVQVLVTELNREPCANQGRARRCDRGRKPYNATLESFLRGRLGWRLIRESEDLPEHIRSTPRGGWAA
mgnify:FL=1